jgi:hypothetical protein
MTGLNKNGPPRTSQQAEIDKKKDSDTGPTPNQEGPKSKPIRKDA